MSRPPRLPPQPVVFIPGGLALGFLGPPDMLLFHLVSYVFMGVMGIPGYFFFRNPKNLQRCHVWVKALADRGEHSEAAGVAALMGKYGPAKTLKIAKGSIRGIGFGSLCETRNNFIHGRRIHDADMEGTAAGNAHARVQRSM